MRPIRVLALALLAVLAISASPAAAANPSRGQLLADWWSSIFVQAAPDNPFLGGGDLCPVLSGGVLAPVGQPGGTVTCTARPGQKVLIVAVTNECSTIEEPPYLATDPKQATDCALAGLEGVGTVTVTVDGGRPIDIGEKSTVTSPWTTVDVPEDNVFAEQGGTASFAAAGRVLLLHPLRPGRHVIHLSVTGEVAPGEGDFIIDVVPRGRA